VRRTLAEKARLAPGIVLVGMLIFSSLSSPLSNQRWTAVSTISTVRADSTRTDLSQVLDDAVNYLYVNYNDDVGLIRESPDHEFENNYWVYSDNYLASLVLGHYNKSLAHDITSKLSLYLSRSGICNPMNMYMALEERVFYFDNPQTVILAKVGDATVNTTMNNRIGDPLLPWNYSDVAFLQAVYYHESGNESGAMKAYQYGVNRFDGKGFKDDAFNDTHNYTTYKLALYIYASKLLEQHYDRQANDTLLDTQQPDGGFATFYNSSLQSISEKNNGTNTETTSLAILALMTVSAKSADGGVASLLAIVVIAFAAIASVAYLLIRKKRGIPPKTPITPPRS
jgi:hypothetical protein